jgi:hypothetical protein
MAHPVNPNAATLMAAAIMKNRMSQILLNYLGRPESDSKLLTRLKSHCRHSSVAFVRVSTSETAGSHQTPLNGTGA